MDHIVNNLWLGGQRDADQLIRSNPENITAILNVRGADAHQPPGRDQSAEHPGKAYKWISAPDTGLIISRHICEAQGWLQEQIHNRERILVHCMFGISRAPAFLAAFMVKSGISSTLDDAIDTILRHRQVRPAVEIAEPERRVILTSALTGLPNRQAFDQGKASSFLAILNVELMKLFNDSYGPIAADMLVRHLAKILSGVGLNVYHSHEDEFLCKGESSEELNAKLCQARKIFRQPLELYADGRIQIIEGADFSFSIGTNLEEQKRALRKAPSPHPRTAPEWLRKIAANAGPGERW